MKYMKGLAAAAAALLLSACSYGLTDGGVSSNALSSTQEAVSTSDGSSMAASSQAQAPEESSQASSGNSSTEGDGSANVNNSDWRLILANRANPLPDDFTVDVVETIGTYKFDKRASDDLKAFMDAAKSDGISLTVISTFRKQSTQERLYAEKVAEYVNQGYDEDAAKEEAARWVAIPGTSEHQTGLAFDVVSSDWYSTHDDLYETFEDTKEFAWLSSHCAEYGFVLRYPRDKQDITGITYEPWHYRYVGRENAEEMTEHNLCLEEFVGAK